MKLKDVIRPERDGLFLRTTRFEEHRLLDILYAEKATRGQRLFFVGRLKFFGYGEMEIMDVIRKLNAWENYDDTKTSVWVAWMFGRKGMHQPYVKVKQDKKIVTVDDLVHEFMSHVTLIPPMHVPEDVSLAARFYSDHGFHVVPKSSEGKHPSIPWRPYADRKPSPFELSKWDWSNGLCLLATHERVFLDIDVPGHVDVQGHVEHTPRGGMHVFGHGRVGTQIVPGVGEIKGYGSLIVSAPSMGYVSG